MIKLAIIKINLWLIQTVGKVALEYIPQSQIINHLSAAAFDSEKQQSISKSGGSSFEPSQASAVRCTLTSVIYPKRFLIIVTSNVPVDWE